MAVPYITVTFDPPQSTDTDGDFDTKASDTAGKLNPWGVEANDLADWIGTKADQALAAALGADLPTIAGNAGQFLRVNAGGTAAEFYALGTVQDADLLDEDDMTSNSAVDVPSQQSVKAYIYSQVAPNGNDNTPVRVVDTTYQNTQGRPILVCVSGSSSASTGLFLEVSQDGVTWFRASGNGSQNNDTNIAVSVMVPDTWRYRIKMPAGATFTVQTWMEVY